MYKKVNQTGFDPYRESETPLKKIKVKTWLGPSLHSMDFNFYSIIFKKKNSQNLFKILKVLSMNVPKMGKNVNFFNKFQQVLTK